jgi:hypothetical protein
MYIFINRQRTFFFKDLYLSVICIYIIHFIFYFIFSFDVIKIVYDKLLDMKGSAK